MKVFYCCLSIAAIALSGCGGAAHQEAVGLGKILAQGQPDFAAANATEKQLVAATRTWSDGIIASGGGKGAQLEQNATIAGDLAKSAETVSTQLGQLRKAVYDLSLQKEFIQGVRSTLITEITKRQRTLQDLRTSLTEAAAQFRELSQTRSYKGEGYPTAVDKLNQMAFGYKTPPDIVGNALNSLKEEYGLKDVDLAAPAAAH